MGTVHLWRVICPGATRLSQTFWLGLFSWTLKAAAVLSLWPKIPDGNSDSSETEGEEGFDNADFEEQRALGNTPKLGVQPRVGDGVKCNSCNNEQSKGKQRKKRDSF